MEESFFVKIIVDDLFFIFGVGCEWMKYDNNEVFGVVIGLVWMFVGGEILFIEFFFIKGKGKLILIGNLGDVMKELVVIVLEFLKVYFGFIGLEQEIFDEWNVYIYVLEGVIFKDGLSVGIIMFMVLVFFFFGCCVKKYLVMIGEIMLCGEVLLVGGIKEKILVVKWVNIKEIILCECN